MFSTLSERMSQSFSQCSAETVVETERKHSFFVGADGATSLKAEIVARVPKICDAATFREARDLLERLGGAQALREELCFSGFIDPSTGLLTVNDKPFNVFAHFAAGKMEQTVLAAEQDALGDYTAKFLICANRPDNDRHWDSTDPKWMSKASMARRHRFLTIKNLHWQWFNLLVVGLVPSELDGISPREALTVVEEMKAAALRFARNVGGWSDQVGLYVNVFGHNNVNSLFVHILDMTEVGPGFSVQAFKNCPLDAVLKVLREEAASSMTVSVSKPIMPMRPSRSRVSSVGGKHFFFAGTDGATSLKAEIIGRIPVLKDASSFREARRLLVEELGGAGTLREELIRAGFVNEDTNQLTTGNNPFNIFAKCAAGALQQPNMAAEQLLLGKFKDEFMICSNRPENDEHWDSEDPEWVGKASMSRCHRFLTSKDLHFQWFNALLFGLVEQDEWGGVSKVTALAQIEKMKAAALKYATAVEGWSDKVGIFFHVFGHNTVNSLHLHILDMKALGPTFWKYEYKNLSIDAVIKVLKEEIDHEQGAEGRLQRLELAACQAAMVASEAASFMGKSSSLQPSKWQGGGSGEVVQLNVGGEPVSIAKETLQIAPKGSLLREMFNDRWDGHQHQFDAEGRVFLNFPPRAFKIIADHLRMLHLTPNTALLNPPRVPWELQDEVLELSWHLGVHPLIDGPQWGRGESRGLPPKPRPPSRFCGRRRPPPPPRLRKPAEQPSEFTNVSIDVR